MKFLINTAALVLSSISLQDVIRAVPSVDVVRAEVVAVSDAVRGVEQVVPARVGRSSVVNETVAGPGVVDVVAAARAVVETCVSNSVAVDSCNEVSVQVVDRAVGQAVGTGWQRDVEPTVDVGGVASAVSVGLLPLVQCEVEVQQALPYYYVSDLVSRDVVRQAVRV